MSRMPDGDEISIDMSNWREKFAEWIQQKKIIKYSLHKMPTIPDDIERLLQKYGYMDIILENDHWEHVLVPRRS